MKVLLIKDVYKLGRAGEVKKVAAGYARNFLIPQSFAIPVTPGAMHQAERIKEKATERRAVLNEELGSVAEVLNAKKLFFPVKAGETGSLYGSVSGDDIIKAVMENYEIELEKRQVETEPIRKLGTYQVPIHLTMDLIPEILVVVHREGEVPSEEDEKEDGVSEENAAQDNEVIDESETVDETAEEIEDIEESEVAEEES